MFLLLNKVLSQVGLDDQYCVIHGLRYEKEKIKGDVDLCIRETHFDIFTEKLADSIAENGGFILSHYSHFGGGMIINTCFPKRLLSIRFDLYVRPKLSSLKTYPELIYSVSSEEFLNQTIRKNGLMLCQPEVEFCHYLCRKVIKDDLNSTVYDYLRQLFNESDQSNLKQSLIELVSEETSQLIIEHFKSSEDSSISNNLQHLISKEIRSSTKCVRKNKLISFCKRLGQIPDKRGAHIAFIAPDGAGKSSAIARVQPILSVLYPTVIYEHLRPKLLPARTKATSGKIPKPHESKEFGLIKSVLKLFFLMMDYVLGYIVHVSTQKFRGNLVIYDRYFYDLYADPRRFRIKLSRGLIKILILILPRPDTTFMLVADASTIRQRKKDLTFDEIVEQLALYDDFRISNKEVVVINSEMEIDNVAIQILETFCKRHSLSKTQKR